MGHLLSHHDILSLITTQGRIEKKKIERPRLTYVENIKQGNGCISHTWKRKKLVISRGGG